MNSLVRGWKTVRQVGLLPVLQVALYRFGLVTGHYRRLTPPGPHICPEASYRWRDYSQDPYTGPLADFLTGHPEVGEECLREASLILQGQCRIFGQTTADIFRGDIDTSHHWTEYEQHKIPLPEKDVKFIWEPSRLGWIYTLGRVKASGKVESLGKQSWNLLESFLQKNPVNCGPNWMNGQEIALRILALVFFHDVFRDDPELPAGWDRTLAQAVIDHARRIPPTLVYARSQQNNHLLVEAAGLYTAGVFLQEHDEAGRWRKTGWNTFHQALNDQIDDDGTYAQYSTNYHRLMLQIALWMKAVSVRVGDGFPETTSDKLAAATAWLAGLTMPETGRVPNYGHNDGAYILPLTGRPFEDYRPVVEAASHFFGPTFPAGDVDEMTLWFEYLAGKKAGPTLENLPVIEITSYRKLTEGSTTVFVFEPDYRHRPGQADLLHTEIWRDGLPLLLDAGTFQYNAEPPWDNVLAGTAVHNTVSILGKDQMTRAGRFLWLDWPKVSSEKEQPGGYAVTVSHDGYKRFGVKHKRRVELVNRSLCRVYDEILYTGRGTPPEQEVWLHWLLPPLHFSNTDMDALRLHREESKPEILLSISTSTNDNSDQIEHQRIRMGGMVYTSSHESKTTRDLIRFGWYSPTYGVKEPAISYRVIVRGQLPITFVTEIQV
jgi:hypothetical protein